MYRTIYGFYEKYLDFTYPFTERDFLFVDMRVKKDSIIIEELKKTRELVLRMSEILGKGERSISELG